ncbi:MAG: pentapeptide repeat-containing protein, partial [Actinobacteria bacterium]|nr:pentapeptide repeat-containing protein [Actinomycetota bacterium]
GALLRGANMSEVTFLGPVDLTGADLNGVDLDKADLSQAYVVSSGDTGNLGCGIKGDPRLLPHGWALTGPERCLKTKVNAGGSGDTGSAAPHACGRMMIPKQSSRLLKSEAGQASVYARGMTCGEANALVEEVTQDGAVTRDELQRALSPLLADPSQQQEDPSQQQEEELWISMPDGDDHAAKAFRVRVMRFAIGWPRITISSETVEVHQDNLEKRAMKETLPICAPADRLGWRTGTCQPG